MNETTHHRESIEQLAEEFAERYRRGERPTIDEYVAAHPDLAAEIRDLFPTLAMIEELAPSDSSEPEALATGGVSIEVKPLDRIGDFRILREIGRGGMGVVYEAEQESLGRRVALKVLPLHSASDPKMLARFRRESRAAGQLHHTNIVPIFEVGEYGDICWYAMQFIPGQALDEIVKELQRLRTGKSTEPVRPSPMTESLINDSMARGSQLNRTEAYQPAKETAVAATDSTPNPHSNRSALEVVELDFRLCCRNVARIGLQAAEALAYAHARGVIHRDIKPSNLLLDTAGIVWVSDFGLAKTQDHALTETGDIVGTVRYMAPERFRGECDARSDVYSLGVTLYELLTLRPAFDHTDRLKLIESIGKSEPIKPRAVEPQVPRDVETIVLKAIDKDPRGRYATADAMAADLRCYLNDEPIQARRIGPAERVWRWVRKNPVVTGLMAAVVAVGLLGHMAVVNEKQKVQAQRDEARTTRDELRGTLYSSQMNLVQSAYEADNVARALDILDQQRPKDGEPDLRGFEWHYWQRQCQGDAKTVPLFPIHELFRSSRFVFSPDGNLIVSAPGSDSAFPSTPAMIDRLNVWKAGTGQYHFDAPLPAGPRGAGVHYAPVFSADGQEIATVFVNGTFANAESATTQVLFRAMQGDLAGHELRSFRIAGTVSSIAFTPDRKQFIGVHRTGDFRHPTQRLKTWDVVSGQETNSTGLTSESYQAVGPPVITPDGKFVALVEMERPKSGEGDVGTSRRAVVSIGGIEPGSPRISLETVHPNATVRISPDGRWLCAANPDGLDVIIWNLKRNVKEWHWRVRASIAANDDLPNSTFVAFSPDSTKLAVGGTWSPTAQVWDLETGRMIRLLKSHTQPIQGVAFHRASGRVLTIAGDRTIKSWPASTTEPRPDSRFMTYQAVSRDGRLVAANDSHSRDNPAITIQEAKTGKIVQRIDTSTISATTPASLSIRRFDYLTFSGDGNYLIVPADDREQRQTVLRVIDVSNGKSIRTIPLGEQVSTSIDVRVSDDSQRLAAEWVDKNDERPTRTPVNRVTRHVVWNFASGKEVFNTLVPRGDSGSWALSPDGRKLAVPRDGLSVQVWTDTGEGRKMSSIPTGRGVTAVGFGPSGRGVLVMTGGRGDGATASIGTAYDTATGEVLTSVRGVFGYGYRIAFSPDGRRLAISSVIQETQTGEVKVWDMESQRELMTLRFPEMYPRSLHFSPDGHKLIMLGGRTGVHIWDGTPAIE